jgi:hypothetical protein
MVAFNLLTTLAIESGLDVRQKGEDFLIRHQRHTSRKGDTPLNYEYFYRHPFIEQSLLPKDTSSPSL